MPRASWDRGPEGCWGRAGGLGHRAQPVLGPLQARARHAMQFPAELTRETCRTHPGELRLICIYFFNAHFFKVSTTVGPGGGH